MSRINNEPTVFGHPNFFNSSLDKTKEAEAPKDIHLQIEEAAKALEEINPVIKKSQSNTPYILLGVALTAIAALAYQNYSLSQQIVSPNPATPSFTPACKSLGECWKFDRIECQNLLHKLFGTTSELDLTSFLDNQLDKVHTYFEKTPDQIQLSDSITFGSGTSYLNALIQSGCSNTIHKIDFSKFSDKEISNSLISASRARNEELVEKLSTIVKERNILIDPAIIDQMIYENLDSPINQNLIGLKNYEGRKVTQFDAKTRIEKEAMIKRIVQQPMFKLVMRGDLTQIAEALSAGAITDKNKVHNALEHYYKFNPQALKDFLTEHSEYRTAFENHDSRIQMNKYCPIENIAFEKV